MREHDDLILYVITSGLKGVYSIAEVVDDSNKRPDKVIFCVLEDEFDRQMKHSLLATMNLVRDNGCYVCSSLFEVAQYINDKCK